MSSIFLFDIGISAVPTKSSKCHDSEQNNDYSTQVFLYTHTQSPPPPNLSQWLLLVFAALYSFIFISQNTGIIPHLYVWDILPPGLWHGHSTLLPVIKDTCLRITIYKACQNMTEIYWLYVLTLDLKEPTSVSNSWHHTFRKKWNNSHKLKFLNKLQT